MTSAMSGITANATSASRQSSSSIATMIATSVKTSPNTDTTPDVNSSLSASTSVVTRVISRPTGLRSKKLHVEPLQVLVDLHPQVEHDALPRHLQRRGLHELEHELRQRAWPDTARRSGASPLQSAAGM